MLLYVGGFIFFLVIFLIFSLTKKKKRITFKNISKPATTIEAVNETVERVSKNKEKWSKLSYAKKLDYLKNLLVALDSLQDEWRILSNKVRHYDAPPLTAAGGLFGPGILGGHLNCLIECYESLVKTGELPKPISEREIDGQKILQVYPRNAKDKILKVIVSGELWLQPGKEATQGRFLKEEPGLVAVLGAGNFEAPTDVLVQMFVHNKVVVYKSHPINAASVDPIFPRLFRSLIDDGYFGFCSGGPEIGQALLHHPLVNEGMMTGGCATFDRIVWGDPSEQDKRKEENNPVFF